ncbi:MAG TPA: hypothetical protein VFV08_15205, partial [Puia sp.]|nr:hypothetical protein [Puia sp.]
MADSDLKLLINKYIGGQLTEEEKVELRRMLLLPENRSRLDELLQSSFTDPDLKETGDPETMALIYQQLLLQRNTAPARVIVIPWKKLAVAASVLIIMGSAV